MYGTRNSKRTAMQDKSNLSSKTNFIENRKILEKIPLIEATKTLRPRRGCKKILGENNTKENNVLQHKSSTTFREFPKKETNLKLSNSENNVSKILKKLPVSGKNVKILNNENSSKSGILQSIQNLNLKSNKSELKCNTKNKIKVPLKTIYQNEENREKRDEMAVPVKATQERSIMRKFPKWISQGMESLRRGKKRSFNLDVYDIEGDKDLMLEKSLTKKVVKKARITQTKNYSSKQDSRTFTGKNTKSHLNKKYKSTKVVAKHPAKVYSEACPRFKKADGQIAQNRLLASQTQEVTNINVIHFGSEKPSAIIKTDIPNKEASQSKQLVESNIQKTVCVPRVEKASSKTEEASKTLYSANDNMGKSAEKQETPEKCPQIQILHCNNEIDSSLNLQAFPMPQSSSTPQNVDKPNTPAQMFCSSFDVTMLEIPHSQDMQVDFSDSEFLSPEKASDGFEIQLFDSPINKEKKDSVNDKARNKPLGVKNLNSSLNVKLQQMKGDTLKSNQLSLTDSLLQTEKEFLQFPSVEIHLVSSAVTTCGEETNIPTNQDKRQKVPKILEQIKKNTTRPKRACQQHKPVMEESSDTESLPENDPDPHETTLFESPEKEGSRKEDPLKCLPSTTTLENSFPEKRNLSPLKVVHVEERVLKPRKSYHSAAQLKLIRTELRQKAKKESKVQKIAQTQHDKLIESLNEHFAELENMDLCIE